MSPADTTDAPGSQAEQAVEQEASSVQPDTAVPASPAAAAESPADESPSDESPAAESPAAEKPEIKLLSIPPAKHSSPGCSSRWAAAGCLGAIAMLVLAIISGVLSIDTSFHMLVNRARNRIWNNLPADLSPEQRLRTLHNLQRLPDDIAKAPDPNYTVGQFLGMAGSVLQDRSLSHEELEELNRFMEALAAGDDKTAAPQHPPGHAVPQ